MDFDIEKAPQDCPATWALLAKGLTKGVFQLESPLGRQWTKRLKPTNIEHLTALGAILRPGCMQNIDENGVNTTKHYCLRKNGEEEIASYHPVVDAILFPTYNVLAYQEQAMAIAQAIAGFSLQDADVLRKAIGKKLPAEMAKCKKMFIDGVEKAGIISKEQGEDLFAQIEKSQRYSFNKSHACCYGMTGYDCAYIKAHFPLAFFTSWLVQSKHKGSKDKKKGKGGPLQEIYELVNDAKLFDIAIETPDLRNLESDFSTDRKVVKFGLSNIKGIGEAQIAKLKDTISVVQKELNRPMSQWSWIEFLVNAGSKMSSNLVTSLIEVGGLSWFKMQRQVMLAEYDAWASLTEKEQEFAIHNQEKFKDIIGLLEVIGVPKSEGGGCANKNRVSAVQSRVSLLKNPPTPLIDNSNWIAWSEEQLLGISISCSKIDGCDLTSVNTSCKEFLAGKAGYLILGVEVQRVKEVKTKNGKTPGAKMAWLTISDGTCALSDVAVWPETWKEFGGLLSEGNSVIIQAERDYKDKSNDLLIIKKVWQAKNG